MASIGKNNRSQAAHGAVRELRINEELTCDREEWREASVEWYRFRYGAEDNEAEVQRRRILEWEEKANAEIWAMRAEGDWPRLRGLGGPGRAR